MALFIVRQVKVFSAAATIPGTAFRSCVRAWKVRVPIQLPTEFLKWNYSPRNFHLQCTALYDKLPLG